MWHDICHLYFQIEQKMTTSYDFSCMKSLYVIYAQFVYLQTINLLNSILNKKIVIVVRYIWTMDFQYDVGIFDHPLYIIVKCQENNLVC